MHVEQEFAPNTEHPTFEHTHNEPNDFNYGELNQHHNIDRDDLTLLLKLMNVHRRNVKHYQQALELLQQRLAEERYFPIFHMFPLMESRFI